MQRVGRDQNGVVHTLDAHIHTGGHARKHAGDLVQENLRRVGAGGVGFIDLGHFTAQRIAADGLHGDACRLPHRQGENIRLIHADGDGHAHIRRQHHNVRGRAVAVQIRHGIYAAGDGRGQAAAFLDLQQLQQRLLLLAAAAQQRIIAGAGGGICQAEQAAGCINHLVQRYIHPAHGAGIARDLQSSVNIQFARAQSLAGRCLDGDRIAAGRAIVGHQHGGSAVYRLFHGTGDPAAVREGDRHRISRLGRTGLNIHCHISVQRELRQCAVGHHGVLYRCALLHIEHFHPAGHPGSDVAADGIALGIGNVVIQRLDLRLQRRHGAADAGHIHGSQQVALLHRIAVLHQYLRYLHAGGHGNRLGIHIGEHPGAGHHRADGSPLHLGAEHLLRAGGELLLHLTAQIENAAGQPRRQKAYNDDHRADDLPPPGLFVPAKHLKQRFIPAGRYILLRFSDHNCSLPSGSSALSLFLFIVALDSEKNLKTIQRGC